MSIDEEKHKREEKGETLEGGVPSHGAPGKDAHDHLHKEEREKKRGEQFTHKEAKKDKKVKITEHELNAFQAKANELDELKDTLLRKVADFENAKKRLHKEKEDFAKFANERIIASFLPVLDNLDRALAHTDSMSTMEGLISGVNLIKKQIFDILKNNGLEKIDALGKHFDPHVHEAIGTVETTAHEPDTVVEEIQQGYVLKDKLIRPAWVRIAAGPQEEKVAEEKTEKKAEEKEEEKQEEQERS